MTTNYERIKNMAENEKLKIQLMQKDEINTFFNTPIKGWSNDPCGICKYKQALEEINEIAKTCSNSDACCDCKYCDDCEIKNVEPLTYDICQLILKKFEVLNA